MPRGELYVMSIPDNHIILFFLYTASKAKFQYDVVLFDFFSITTCTDVCIFKIS